VKNRAVAQKAKQKKPAGGLRPLSVPESHPYTLPNGLKVTVVPRPQLPLTAARLVFRAGSAYDPADRHGVADFSARLLRRGAAGITGDQLADKIDFMAATISGWASEDQLGIVMGAPSKHLAATLDLFGKMLTQPDFPEAEVDLARRRMLAAIANELDDPGACADRALLRAQFGDHPYGHEVGGGSKDIRALSRADLSANHKRLSPGLGDLYLVGDVALDSALLTVEKSLGSWKGDGARMPEVPRWEGPARKGQVVIVDKPEQTQVQVRLGARGIPRGHRDHFPVSVMNTVLGGSFTSRLVKEIRVKRGLTYGVGCHFDMMSAAGTFGLNSFTKTETAVELVEISLAEIQRMREKGPKAAEVESVQRYICGLYPARLETNEALAGALSDVSFYGLPADWIAQFRERIAAVTVQQAAEAAGAHLPAPGDTVLVLVGNAEALKKPFEKFGPVTVWKPSDLE
jgi:zinc protease